ncbi:MAG: GMC family oxidoreductase [Deltaproteobacteria bacterium]|nr:GMC family oxidoreductase [Deltaproteobacteria bacterium]
MSTDSVVDAIIVGSGPSAVNAAYPLVEAGLTVRMLDVGNRDSKYAGLIPDGQFSELRRTDPDQHRYFLGDELEGIGFGHTGAGAQLTPPRQYVCKDTERLQPIASESFFPLQSLAEGGLGGAWGAGSPPFSAADLAGFPIALEDLQPHYEVVADRIGVSGTRDDLMPFLGPTFALQPPVEVDSNGEGILRRYATQRGVLNKAGMFLGHPRIAMLSREHRGRLANRYWDMDFWSDAGKSVYRPKWTLDELKTFASFSIVSRRLVRSFEERDDGEVVVTAANVDGSGTELHRARSLVLAAGTLGSTRIVLRSMGHVDRRVPIVCNPHSYAALLNLNTLGQGVRDERHSMAQFCLVHAPDGHTRPFTVGHFYSYRSLLLFRLIRDTPLPVRESLTIMRHLSPSLGALILQHRDTPSPTKYCSLGAGEDAPLEIEYSLSASEQRRIDDVEAEITRGLRRLRCIKLKTMRPGHAASVHYAGTLPMSATDVELTTSRDGRLHRTKRVYVADGSVFPSLPSKGLTFTMMANADRIGCHVRSTLRA